MSKPLIADRGGIARNKLKTFTACNALLQAPVGFHVPLVQQLSHRRQWQLHFGVTITVNVHLLIFHTPPFRIIVQTTRVFCDRKSRLFLLLTREEGKIRQTMSRVICRGRSGPDGWTGKPKELASFGVTVEFLN